MPGWARNITIVNSGFWATRLGRGVGGAIPASVGYSVVTVGPTQSDLECYTGTLNIAFEFCAIEPLAREGRDSPCGRGV